MPDPSLEAAYRDTDYRVEDSPIGPFVIRIGEPCPELVALLRVVGNTAWAFITACNPGSERRPDAENARRTNELQAVLVADGWPHYLGVGAGRDGTWPPEPSFLVVGIPEGRAVEVARRFGQNAVVVGGAEGVGRLVWTGDVTSDE